MAEGTYGSPFYRQIVSPTEPSTPSSKFATSVTRKKTRKWVEAKKINYDGSGWGDDDDEDDDEYEDDTADPPVPAVPASAAGPRALPSQKSSLPSAGLASRNPSPHPALHLQTEQQSPSPSPTSSLPSQSLPSQSLPSQSLPSQSLPSQSLPSQSLPSQQPWRQGSPAPTSTRNSSPGISSPRSGALPTWRDGRSESPLGPRGQSPANSAGPNGPRAFVRPSDMYRSVGQDEPRVRKAVEQPTTPAPAAPAPVELPAAVVEPIAIPTPQPTAQSKILDFNKPTPPAAPAPSSITETVIETPTITAEPSSETADATGTVTDANGERRFSSSPKLPDLARFSMFSPDSLFGGSNFLSSNASAQRADAARAQEASNTLAVAPQLKLGSVVEDVDRASGTASPFSVSSIKSGSAIRDSAATAASAATMSSSVADAPESTLGGAVGSGESTRAASPEAKKESLQGVATAKPDFSVTDQIAPLRPNRASELFHASAPAISLPVAPMGPRVLGTTDTADTVSPSVTSSPVKESDVLREEIIRTLSPVKSAQPDRNMNEIDAKNDTPSTANIAKTEGGSLSEPTRALTRESSYLQDVYDDYWTPDEGGGQEEYMPPPVPPLSTANAASTAASASEAAAAPAVTESPEMATGSRYNLPSQTQQVPPLVNSPSPPPSARVAGPKPSAVPTSISSVPGTRSSSLATPSNLRRRFSWEAEPESSAIPAPSQTEPQSQSTSPAPAAGAITTPPAAQDSSSSVLDPKISMLEVSALSASQDPMPETPAPEAPIRSMLDVGDEKPVLPSMLDVDDIPAVAAASSTPAAPTATAAAMVPATAVEDVVSPAASAAATADAAVANRGSVSESMRSARSGQSVQSPIPAAPSSAQSNEIGQGGLGGNNPAIFGSGNEGTSQFLTLRQCMAFGTHSERMAKLTETRHEYSVAESGLSGWLTNMTVMPEYTRASYAPLWDGPLTVPPPARPAAAAVAAISHVPHVNITSSQITHKGKEIFGVAAGKAGKGLLALRKKGFHKKSAN